MKCSKHPRYKGILKPRVPCEACWSIYLGVCKTCAPVEKRLYREEWEEADRQRMGGRK